MWQVDSRNFAYIILTDIPFVCLQLVLPVIVLSQTLAEKRVIAWISVVKSQNYWIHLDDPHKFMQMN